MVLWCIVKVKNTSNVVILGVFTLWEFDLCNFLYVSDSATVKKYSIYLKKERIERYIQNVNLIIFDYEE